MTAPIELSEIPLDYSAREALETALGKGAGAKIYQQIVERVGKEPGKNLGHGMKGVVYDLGDGRVLKLTADASELEAMTLMKDSKHPNLVRVEDVFVVCRGLSGVGVVVREWVGNVLEEFEGDKRLVIALSIAVEHASRYAENYEEGDPAGDSLLTGMEDLLAYLEDMGQDPAEEKVVKGLRSGLFELRRIGVYGIDFHPRNIAIDDGGAPVIFDVGVVELEKPVKVNRIGCTDRRIVSFSAD